jgi:glutathione S-transferase
MLGKDLEVVCVTEAQRAEKEMKNKNPFDRFPMLECPEGVLFDTLAICKFLAHGSNLLGSNCTQHAKIISDIKMIET